MDLGTGVSIGGALLGAFGQHQANATNVKLAREQMRFQERMSSTAVQRHRSDLEAAGFNPMLGVAGAGSGASTPVGASARVENAPGAGMHSGLSVKLAEGQLELLKQQAIKTSSEELLARSQAHALQKLNPRQVEEMEARTRVERLHGDTLEKLLPLVAQHMSAETARLISSAAEGRSHARLLDAEAVLKEFERNYFKNLSDAQKSWYMRNVNPYVSSAAEVVRTGATVGTAVGVGRGARALSRSSRSPGFPTGVRGIPVPGDATGNLMPRGTPIIDRRTGNVLGTRR